MASNYWIKLYHEILDDPKMGRLPDRLWRRTIELFLLAGDMGQPEGELPPVSDMAWRLRVTDEELEEDLQQLEKIGLVTKCTSGYCVTNFAKRQAPMSDAERKRRQRERDRVESFSGHTPDTPSSHDCHAIVTDRDTDIDTDSESESESESDTDSREVTPPPTHRKLAKKRRQEEQVQVKNGLSGDISGALKETGVFPDLWPEVARSGRSDPEIMALLSWSKDSGSETPGALFMSRLRSGASPPARYMLEPCPGCGQQGDHHPACGNRYTSGHLASHIEH